MRVRLRLPSVARLREALVALRRRPGDEESRGARWLREALWVVGGLSAMGFVFVVSFFLAMRVSLNETAVAVPDLHGMTLEEASQAVSATDLVLQVVDQRNDPAVPSDRILQQSPPADVSVRRGRKIKLVMSLGGKVLDVPDLRGAAARAVEIELRQQGFVPGDEVQVPSSAPTGSVIAQVPPPETPAVPSSRVHRLVSTGPPIPQFVMVDLTGLRRDEAERWIERNGFRRGAVRRVSMGRRESGLVVGQLPLPGYPVRSNDVIDLTIAN